MTFQPPSKQRIAFLDQAATTYHQQLAAGTPAALHLESRGLTWDSARYFRLGYVGSPISGHERYAGMLAIPYINMQGVVAIRYRCLAGHDCKELGHGKYTREPGDEAKIYNIKTLTLNVRRIAVCEGEIDTMTAWQCGIPTIGVSGAQNWKPLFHRHIRGYEEVVNLADGDDAGLKLADTIMGKNEHASLAQMPQGSDVNKYYIDHGAEALKTKARF
ncbi:MULTISPECIES: toprim domain-containing protein [unclassified Streptomyces]|uniref:toprim domain-containing protein n=1 Tax=unclassified Streptomyces TaxID=2593676 RepID=UPI0022AF9353|nr:MULTISPECIES: toprim domain-containing protein [unclassified Streptomyces]MCZ4097328.1 toprim domain-containing protein [Streptomyces sp. H39-C1]MCZ4120632.1 toprim domain-containing protein [Streptomyces sp. H39-S7]